MTSLALFRQAACVTEIAYIRLFSRGEHKRVMAVYSPFARSWRRERRQAVSAMSAMGAVLQSLATSPYRLTPTPTPTCARRHFLLATVQEAARA